MFSSNLWQYLEIPDTLKLTHTYIRSKLYSHPFMSFWVSVFSFNLLVGKKQQQQQQWSIAYQKCSVVQPIASVPPYLFVPLHRLPRAWHGCCTGPTTIQAQTTVRLSKHLPFLSLLEWAVVCECSIGLTGRDGTLFLGTPHVQPAQLPPPTGGLSQKARAATAMFLLTRVLRFLFFFKSFLHVPRLLGRACIPLPRLLPRSPLRRAIFVDWRVKYECRAEK